MSTYSSAYDRSVLLYWQGLLAAGLPDAAGVGIPELPIPAGHDPDERFTAVTLEPVGAAQVEKPMTVREERKQQTRQALLDAALSLAKAGGGFSSLSLREVTREAGLVPTAFYRHFRGMDELGLALVDDACLTLRRLLRDARMHSMGAFGIAIRDSVKVYLGFVRQHAEAFEFITRERSGGSVVVREAIAREIRYFINELAADLRIFPVVRELSSDDLEMIADLVVTTIANLAQDVLSLPPGQSRLEQDLETRAVKQLRLIFLGASLWRPQAPRRPEGS